MEEYIKFYNVTMPRMRRSQQESIEKGEDCTSNSHELMYNSERGLQHCKLTLQTVKKTDKCMCHNDGVLTTKTPESTYCNSWCSFNSREHVSTTEPLALPKAFNNTINCKTNAKIKVHSDSSSDQ